MKISIIMIIYQIRFYKSGKFMNLKTTTLSISKCIWSLITKIIKLQESSQRIGNLCNGLRRTTISRFSLAPHFSFW